MQCQPDYLELGTRLFHNATRLCGIYRHTAAAHDGLGQFIDNRFVIAVQGQHLLNATGLSLSCRTRVDEYIQLRPRAIGRLGRSHLCIGDDGAV